MTEDWDFREDYVACFRNELGDIYNETFPLTEDKRKQKDRERWEMPGTLGKSWGVARLEKEG